MNIATGNEKVIGWGLLISGCLFVVGIINGASESYLFTVGIITLIFLAVNYFYPKRNEKI